MKNNESQHTLTQQFTAIVQRHFDRLLRKNKIALGVIFLTTLFTGLLITGVLEWLFYLPAAAKFTLVGLFLVAAAATLYIYYQKLDVPSFKEFYHKFSKTSGESRLSDALDLHFDSDSRKPALHNAAITQNLENLNAEKIEAHLDQFSQSHNIHQYYKAGLSGALGTFAVLLIFTFWQPSAMDRLAHMWVSYTPPNPYNYTIEPGTITLEQGESFTPTINFTGDYPEQVNLAFKTEIEENFRQRNPVSITEQQAAFSPISLTTDGVYYFQMDGFRSKTFNVQVQLRPRFEQLSLQVIPPEYTGLDTTSYTYPFSKIQAYRGSEIHLSSVTNKPVAKLSLSRTQEDSSLALESTSSPTTFKHQWKVGATDTITFSMADSAGLSNENKFRFVTEPRDDQHPFVNLTSPSDNMKMKSPEQLQLEYEAGDDFGLTGASLRYELQRAFTNKPERGSLSLPTPPMNETQTYTWDIPALDPKPRDVLTYWIEVRDNDAFNGAKAGQSQKLMVTFPSTTEYMEELENRESEVTESMENISSSFERMQQEYDEFEKQLKQNPETNWEQKQQLEEVEEKRKEIEKKVQDLNKKFQEIQKEIEQNSSMSQETMDKYQELQKLVKQINSPELQKALDELRKSLGEMNPDEMQKALENYEFNEEQYKERINRTLELFKSLKLNSDLEKMANSLEELAEQEKKVSESKQSPEQDLEQQKAIEKDLDKVQEQLDDVSQNTPENAKKQVDQLQKDAGQKMKQIQKNIQRNIEQLKKQQQQQFSKPAPSTKKQQRRIREQMQEAAQQMRSTRQQLNKKRQNINMAALKYILYSLINLSTNQEELTKETENLPARSQAFVDKARKEKNISSQFSMLSDSLFQVSSEIPGFSNNINKKKAEVEQQLSNAVERLSERDKSNSTFAQRQSLGGINELASMVASLLEQLQNQQQGGGGGGAMSMQQFMKQLQNMTGQQQQLNKQMQQMINEMQGNRLTRDQMQRLNQMSKQQNRIRKQIQELQRKGQLESGDRVLSELERMSEQMEDTINDMRGGQVNEQLMQRQQNILSRMLSAEKAVQQRGKKDERQGTTADETPQTTPPDITLEQLQQKIRKMLNDPDRTKFTEDYQRLIEQYFELLKKQNRQVIE